MLGSRGWLFVLLLAAGLLVAQGPWRQDAGTPNVDIAPAAPEAPARSVAASRAGLPPEAVETLRLIEARGPFPYDRDGTVFQNREGRLPSRPRGYYREYTVRTPGSPDRGARRIVTGGNPPAEFFYTGDHYRSFQRIEAPTR